VGEWRGSIGWMRGWERAYRCVSVSVPRLDKQRRVYSSQ
jgi:hypothetical protein